MQKDFWSWAKTKAFLNSRTNAPFFYEREVWWCYLGANIGHEQDGKGQEFMRPVLVLKKFNNELCWTLPITTRVKDNKYHHKIPPKDGFDRSVILSQLRVTDARRLREKTETLPEDLCCEIEKAIAILVVSQPPFRRPSP